MKLHLPTNVSNMLSLRSEKKTMITMMVLEFLIFWHMPGVGSSRPADSVVILLNLREYPKEKGTQMEKKDEPNPQTSSLLFFQCTRFVLCGSSQFVQGLGVTKSFLYKHLFVCCSVQGRSFPQVCQVAPLT